MWVPVVSPVAQTARIVFDTPAEIAVWLNGKPLGLSGKSDNKNEPRGAGVELPEGPSNLLIRLSSSAKSSAPAFLVTTVVADSPVGFSAAEGGVAAHAGK